MKKLMSVVVSFLFALSFSGLVLAADVPATKPAPAQVKAEVKTPKAEKKKATKKAKKTKKAAVSPVAPAVK